MRHTPFNANRRLRPLRGLPRGGRRPSIHSWPAPQPRTAAATTDESTARRARVEALLLVASEPLTTRRLAKLARLSDATEARTLVGQLAERYRSRGSGLAIEQVAGGYRLLTRPILAPWVRKMHGISEALQLTPAAMETLAVVAYRQPVLRAEIEAIRGVQCGELLRQLIERDILRIVGRSTDLGRPLQYGTTKRFLEAFGLADLSQLPPLDATSEPAEEQHRRLAA